MIILLVFLLFFGWFYCCIRDVLFFFFFFLMIRRPPRSTQGVSSAASDVYKRQVSTQSTWENPVVKNKYTNWMHFLSTAGHEKSCRNLGGPPSKAKYSAATDSAQYREGKVKRTPGGE
eukprot:TRINITY_DN704_c0_g1_i4.p3 TRINITY_DN704_c0_g1~~TRINITY_DN704_c0_g1_i4.p3  ORF type:complete len:118 (+),score=34.09 TRINITY_DN704_c0_g1_i4:2-355(+)